MDEEFSREKFVDAVGTTFKLTAANDVTMDLKLVEVSELRKRPRQESFSAIFIVPESDTIEQGLYDVENEEMGAMQLFLVPVGMDGNQILVESVFNFLRADDNRPSE